MCKETSLDLCFDITLDDAKLLFSAIDGLVLSDDDLKNYLLRELNYAIHSFDPPAPRPETPQKKWRKW